ncbi:LysR substrate-binding domain-containing protein [Xanthobacter sp. ZOL 2024]
MNQRQINAFRLVMRHGSITAAARALNVSQPAVSRLIADLEYAIGFPLLRRQGGRAEPTAEAFEFITEVERMFYGLERLEVVAHEIRDLRRATLHIATLPMVGFEIVPATLMRFVDAHAGVKVTHDIFESARILDLLASRQIDLGIAQTEADHPDLELLSAYRTDCVCVMRPDHPLADQACIVPRDLHDQPFVALASHTVVAGYVRQCLAEARVAPRIFAETQPSYSACSLAALGVGIAIVDPITPHVFGDRLRVIPFRPLLPFCFQVLKPAGPPLSRAAAQFLAHLRTIIAELPDFGRSVHKISE